MNFDFRISVVGDPARKQRFLREARSRLQALARLLPLPEGSYDLRVNAGGSAVSGEVTLHHERVFVQVSQSVLGPDHGILLRRCRGQRDFTGEQNHFAPLAALDDLGELAEMIWSLALHEEARCSVPGCRQAAWRWFADTSRPDDTFYLCDGHREILSPEDDVVRLLTPAGVPVERELAVYACHEACPVCQP